MIEYCENFYYYKKKKPKRKKFVFSLIFILVFMVSFFCYYKFIVSKKIINICDAYSNHVITETINNSLVKSMLEYVDYQDLITIEKNSLGELVFMSANSMKINTLSRDISLRVQNILTEKLKRGVPIPTLAFFGLDSLSGYGKTIYYKILNFNSVNCSFESQFDGVGINQTLHKIYCNIECAVNINFYSNNQTIKVKAPILITESVVIGKVPEVYLNGTLFN